MALADRRAVTVALGTTQTLAWASSYYLAAILAAPMAKELGLATSTVFAAFSGALAASALVGPWSGRLIDRHGGRPVLIGTNLLFALALAAIGMARDLPTLIAAWLVMGIAMGSGLYEAAFATLVRLYGQQSRNAITGVTLLGGLASTVGWPLTAWMEARYGWRGACFGWVALHLMLGLPLNAWLPRASRRADPAQAKSHAAPSAAPPDAGSSASPPTSPVLIGAVLATVFAAGWFVSTSMAAHFPRVIQAAGASLAVAVAVGAMIGPAQVAGRLLEFGLLRRMHPLLSARLATLAHPLGVAALLIGGPALAPVFGILHGMGNGILTIAMATLPLALFGSQGYGARQGWLMLPARILQALAPFLFGIALERWAASALLLSTALSLVAFGALALLRTPRKGRLHG
ncbi:MAG: MFS transporter [Burkholderiaceae bacterium]|nr:MFS transporter [Burkholderiaceae bacterium]